MEKQHFIQGVFTDIVGTQKELSMFEQFLQGSPTDMSPELTKLTATYRSVVTKWKSQFDTVAVLEETILQLRSRENMYDIKLSLVKGEYIYARAPFFRRVGTTKDLRVIVGRTDIDGDDLEALTKDLKFMERAKRKLGVAMDKIISDNRNILTELLK